MIKRLRPILLFVATVALMVSGAAAVQADQSEKEPGSSDVVTTTVIGDWNVRGTATDEDTFEDAVITRGPWRIATGVARFVDEDPTFRGSARVASPTTYVTTDQLAWTGDRLVASRATVHLPAGRLSVDRVLVDPDADALELERPKLERPGEASVLTWRTAPKEH